MSRYHCNLATAEDDAQLREILAATPMTGQVTVSYRREPSYFGAAIVSGRFHQVVAVRDAEQRRIVGFAARSIRTMHVDGRPTSIGYLGGLRALPEYRNQGLLARGVAYLRELHADGRARVYLATIAEGNDRVMDVLTSGRGGLPSMRNAGQYLALAVPIPTRRRRWSGPGDSVCIAPAVQTDLSQILDFLNTHGPRRQFFPQYGEQDFFNDDAIFRDLRPEDILLARRDGELVGLIGAWDQHAFKQSVVNGYGAALRYVKPAYNLWTRLRGLPGLPQPGEELRYLTAALPVVANDDPAVFTALVRTLLAQASGGPHHYLMLGLHERDPLMPAARRFGGHTYAGRLFVACWPDGETEAAAIDGRPPYLETGSL